MTQRSRATPLGRSILRVRNWWSVMSIPILLLSLLGHQLLLMLLLTLPLLLLLLVVLFAFSLLASSNIWPFTEAVHRCLHPPMILRRRLVWLCVPVLPVIGFVLWVHHLAAMKMWLRRLRIPYLIGVVSH